jgi:hypothetical protein
LINQWISFPFSSARITSDIIISSTFFPPQYIFFPLLPSMKMRNNSSQFISQQSLISTRIFLPLSILI